MLPGDGFGGLGLFQFAFYLHPFYVGDGTRLVQREETLVGVLRLVQCAYRAAVGFGECGGVDCGEHLSFAHLVALIDAYGRDVAAQFEAECRTRLLFYGADIVFCLAFGVGAYGEGFHLYGCFFCLPRLLGAARQHHTADKQRHEPSY